MKLIKCPKKDCQFQNNHLHDIVNHIRHTEGHDLSLVSELQGGSATLANAIGIHNEIKIVGIEVNKELRNAGTCMSYNSILILDTKSIESEESSYSDGCTDCNYKSSVYHNTFRHICRHFKILLKQEYLNNDDYVKALK